MHWLEHAIRDLRAAFWAVPANVGRAVLALVALMIVGTAGYMVIEGWSLLDAFYMTIMVLTTIGFREVHPLSDAGVVFTALLAIGGIGAIFYALISVFQFLLEGELASIIGSQRMKRQIEHLSGHYILCGFGRVGEEIAKEFVERDVEFVVVETTPEAVDRSLKKGYLTIVGDASSDEILRQARIDQASCLLAASDSDSGNTFIVLAAKALNPNLYVVARAAHPDSAPRMTRAGAERVFSPYIIAGRQMAASAIQPLLTEFIDSYADGGSRDGVLGEIEVTPASGAGSTVDQLLANCKNVTVLAIQKKSGELYVGASGAITLGEGDRVILLGDELELQRIRPSGAQAPA